LQFKHHAGFRVGVRDSAEFLLAANSKRAILSFVLNLTAPWHGAQPRQLSSSVEPCFPNVYPLSEWHRIVGLTHVLDRGDGRPFSIADYKAHPVNSFKGGNCRRKSQGQSPAPQTQDYNEPR